MTEPDDHGMTRRSFLRLAGAGGLLAAAGAVTGAFTRRFGEAHAEDPAPAQPAHPLGPEFQYDVERFRHADPALVSHREVRRFSIGFKRAAGIEVDAGGLLWVAGDQQVRRYTVDGRRKPAPVLDFAPGCLALGPEGELFLGAGDHVVVCDAEGKKLATWPSLGERARIISLAVGKEDVFVANADPGGRAVWRLDRAGKVLGKIGEPDPARNIPGFVVPSPFFRVRLAPDGLLRVANPGRHRIEAYTAKGDLEFAWGKTSFEWDGFCGCCNPVNFALLPDGRFVTAEKGLPRVKIYSAQGQFESIVAGPDDFPENRAACDGSPNSNCTQGGLDVATDAQGRIFILDLVTAKIRVMEKK